LQQVFGRVKVAAFLGMIPLCPTAFDSAETHLDLCAKGFAARARDWENNDTGLHGLGILAPAI